MDYKEYEAMLKKQYLDELASIPCEYTDAQVISEEVMVPMSDGAGMKTYIYRPDTPQPVPTLFQRGCYTNHMPMIKIYAPELAKRGFGCVFQFCRGTGGSEGEWEPNVHERPDGIDSIQWLNDQPWVESIGFYGASYLALTGWAMIDVVPEKVKAMYLSVYGTNRHVSAYKDGLFRQDILTAWAMGNAGVPITADYMDSCRHLPHVQVDEDVWGVKLPWYKELVTHTDFSDPYWQEGFWSVLRSNPSKVKIPIVIEEGWYDHHLGSALSGYNDMTDAGRENCLLRIGPWDHGKQCPIHAHECNDVRSYQILPIYQWFDTILRKHEKPESGVSLYVVGQDRWLEQPQWPQEISNMQYYFDMARRTLYPATSADASVTAPADAPADASIAAPTDAQVTDGTVNEVSFVYDPKNPVSSYGAESCFSTRSATGSLKQPEPGYRDDVISFVSEPIAENVMLLGKINADIYVSSDAEDTAFSIKIMEVLENGEAYNIRSGITTLAYRGHSDQRQTYTPGEIVKINIDTWDIAWEMKKGSCIRVDISSSDFPQYSAHTNYPGVWALQDKCRTARQTLYSGAGYPSVLNLPVYEK